MNKKSTFSNNMGNLNGNILLERFFRKCCNKDSDVSGRNYHIGLNSILDIKDKNTIYTNDILTLAEGLSPRLLLMR